MNPQALQLNEQIRQGHPHIYDMLSQLGRNIYFPKQGILSQSAEAKAKAGKYNATIGTAIEHGQPMHLDVIQETLSAYDPKDLYEYAPASGKPELRTAWRSKMLLDNPSIQSTNLGNPIVTSALTHGLSIVADLFVEAGDTVIIPDKNWENYELTFGIRRGAKIVEYPLYNSKGRFNAEGLLEAILSQKPSGKAILILNFPNNPTGYTPDAEEGRTIVEAILAGAEAGINIVVAIDDAYFGLFFEDSLHESIFGQLCNLHPRVLPIKIDGATKEEYAWGFRVGFLTYSSDNAELLTALEQKTMGIIRATLSSGPHPSQTFVLRALSSPDFDKQRKEKYQIMKGRANKVKEVLDSGKYHDVWDYYPFNSGYFMCLKLKNTKAENLRLHLLNHYGIGTIALGDTDLRIAFSCIDEADIPELYDLIYRGAKELAEQPLTTGSNNG